VPTIDDSTVEQHISVGVRDLLRQKGFLKRGMVPNLNGQGRVAYRPTDRLSVQVSWPVHRDEKHPEDSERAFDDTFGWITLLARRHRTLRR
jgi:hypothetical protein